MSLKMKLILAVGGCLVAFAAVALIRGRDSGQPEQAPVAPVKDLSNHPIYSKYDFSGEPDDVIDLGIQPLWIPTCIITEAMKRDTLLMKALAEQGLKIRFHPFLKGADINFFLLRGDLEGGFSGDMPVLTAAVISNAVVAALAQQGFSSIVAMRHMLVKELRGNRIGYGFGSNAHYALLQALSSAGLGEKDVQMVPLDVGQMPQALAEDKIDAFSAWEPTPTIALTKFERAVIIHRSITSGFLYFRRSFTERHRDVVHQIVAAQVRAINWLKNRHQNLLRASRWALQTGSALSGQEITLSAEQYGTLAKNDLLGMTSISAIPERDLTPDGRLYREFEFLKGLGKIPETAEWAKVRACFDPKIMSEVLSGGKKYQLDTFEYSDEESKERASR